MKTQQASENARLALGSLLMVFTGNWAGQEHLSTLAYSFAPPKKGGKGFDRGLRERNVSHDPH